MMTMTPDLIAFMAQEAGDRSMKAAGRHRWNWQDWANACAMIKHMSVYSVDD